MAEIEVKGLAFVNVLNALAELRGETFRRHVLEAMPEASRSALQLGSVIANGWYPVRWYREMLGSAVSVAKDPTLPRELGRASVHRDVKGVHRLLFRIMSVETLQAQGARFFKSYFRPTEVSVQRVEPRVARVLYLHCYGFDRHVWQEQVGVVEGLLEGCKVASPRVLVLDGGGDHDSRLELETRWR